MQRGSAGSTCEQDEAGAGQLRGKNGEGSTSDARQDRLQLMRGEESAPIAAHRPV